MGAVRVPADGHFKHQLLLLQLLPGHLHLHIGPLHQHHALLHHHALLQWVGGGFWRWGGGGGGGDKQGGGPWGEGEGLVMLVIVVVVVLTVAYTPAPAPFVPPSTPSSALPPRSTPVSRWWILAWGGWGWGVETSRGRALGGRWRLNDASNSCGGSVDSSYIHLHLHLLFHHQHHALLVQHAVDQWVRGGFWRGGVEGGRGGDKQGAGLWGKGKA